MRLFFGKSALEDFDRFKADSPELAEKVKSMLNDTLTHPDEGLGAPSRLDGAYSGLWQRTYAPGQIIVYSFAEDRVTVVSIGAWERVLDPIKLETYSKEDEQAVIAQMAANRGRNARRCQKERVL